MAKDAALHWYDHTIRVSQVVTAVMKTGSMDNSYYIADVFTRERFNGAQVAVFPEADQLAGEQMQLLARELNLSEAAFVQGASESDSQFRVRIFSPKRELDFAGHPIIATATVLAVRGELAFAGEQAALVLEHNAGPVNVSVTVGDDDGPGLVQFSQRVTSVVDRFTPTAEELAELLSISTAEIDSKKFAPRLVSCGVPYLIVPVYAYETVRKARFNYVAWSRSTAPQTAAQEILLFSEHNPHADANFNARLLGPNVGLHEDPPVGSAIPAFASYLGSHQHVQQGTHTFSVDRGDDESRRSVLNIEMDHKTEGEVTVRIGGEAVLVAEGRISTP